MTNARRREPVCVICWERPSESAHHGFKKGQGGDDVPANLFGVCGDGTRLCHGLLEANDDEARRKLGEHVLARRPDFIDYLVRKLRGNEVRAVAWLQRHMLVDTNRPIGGA